MMNDFILSSGCSTTFFQGVYGTSIGHYIKYGGKNDQEKKQNNSSLFFSRTDTRKRLIGLHGILVGSGEIIGILDSHGDKENSLTFDFRRRNLWISDKTKNGVSKWFDDSHRIFSTNDLLLFGIGQYSFGCTRQ